MSQELKYVRYDERVEVKQPDEDRLIDDIVASMARVNRRMFDKHRHGVRDAHAKSHGILKGVLTVHDSLPEHLRQGVFQPGASHPIMARLSTAPGDIQNDGIAAPQGMAIKMLGVSGKKVLPGHEEELTQDWLLVNHPTIFFGNVAAYWKVQQLAEKHAGDADLAKRLIAAAAGGAQKALHLLGGSNATLDALGSSPTHILGQTFFSMAALRFGDYIAKISVAPSSSAVKELVGNPVQSDAPSAFRDQVVEFFKTQGAEYEVRVQLCTDLGRMPVEDASIEWAEAESPYVAVAKISFPAQDAYSPARRVYGDDVLSFNPWHCVEAHRPLGSIMRVRIKAYEASSRFRHDMNDRKRVEPRSVDEMPD